MLNSFWEAIGWTEVQGTLLLDWVNQCPGHHYVGQLIEGADLKGKWHLCGIQTCLVSWSISQFFTIAKNTFSRVSSTAFRQHDDSSKQVTQLQFFSRFLNLAICLTAPPVSAIPIDKHCFQSHIRRLCLVHGMEEVSMHVIGNHMYSNRFPAIGMYFDPVYPAA